MKKIESASLFSIDGMFEILFTVSMMTISMMISTICILKLAAFCHRIKNNKLPEAKKALSSLQSSISGLLGMFIFVFLSKVTFSYFISEGKVTFLSGVFWSWLYSLASLLTIISIFTFPIAESWILKKYKMENFDANIPLSSTITMVFYFLIMFVIYGRYSVRGIKSDFAHSLSYPVAIFSQICYFILQMFVLKKVLDRYDAKLKQKEIPEFTPIYYRDPKRQMPPTSPTTN